jgi:hypothetical protein
MAFAVHPQHRSVGVDDRHGVEERSPRTLEPAYRQDDLEGLGEGLEATDRGAFLESGRELEVLGMLLDTKIRCLE